MATTNTPRVETRPGLCSVDLFLDGFEVDRFITDKGADEAVEALAHICACEDLVLELLGRTECIELSSLLDTVERRGPFPADQVSTIVQALLDAGRIQATREPEPRAWLPVTLSQLGHALFYDLAERVSDRGFATFGQVPGATIGTTGHHLAGQHELASLKDAGLLYVVACSGGWTRKGYSASICLTHKGEAYAAWLGLTPKTEAKA